MKLSSVDLSRKQKARIRGRTAARNMWASTMILAGLAVILATLKLADALLRYLQAPRWMANPLLLYALGMALGFCAALGLIKHCRWKLYRLIVRVTWWPTVANNSRAKAE